MHKIKPINFGFVILSPETNFGRLKSTVNSCKGRYPDASIVCVTGKNTIADDIKEMKTLCPVHKGGGTITSLMNTGIKKGHKEWNFILMEGVFLRRELIEKYSRFVENELDVMFSIVIDYDRNMYPSNIYSDFFDCSINGILIHQSTFKKVGDFTDHPMEISRLMWSIEAVEKNVKFKSILGTKIC